MTKRLDPEIKALRAIERALAPLDQKQTKRSLEWLIASRLERPWVTLPALPIRSRPKVVTVDNGEMSVGYPDP